jgi:hypothetical protein
VNEKVIPMVAESEKISYPGVVCSHCGATIPVTGKLAKLRERNKESSADSEESQTQAFPIRCKACDKESISSVDRIREFDGKPKLPRQRFNRKAQ